VQCNVGKGRMRRKGVKEGGKALMTLLKCPFLGETCDNVTKCRYRGGG